MDLKVFFMNDAKSEMEKRDILRLSNFESNKLTKECLQTALIYLMGEKPFEKITITELVKRSGVSRTAFYRNYNSKEEILNEISDELTKMIANAFSKAEKEENTYELYREMFALMRKHSKELGLLIDAGMSRDLFMRILDIVNSEKLSAEQTYYLKGLIGANVSICISWYINGMKEPDEGMAEVLLQVRNGLHSALVQKK